MTKKLSKIKIVLICLLIAIFIVKMPPALAEGDTAKLVFNRIIIPNQEIRILDAIFEVSDDEDDPSILRLIKDDITFILRQNTPLRRFGYEFHLGDKWFDLERIHHRTPDGTPRYGAVSETGGRIYHSYSLRAYLIKPVLEFRRTINNENVSEKSTNIFKGEINDRFEVVLNIINHGKDQVDFVHKEFLDNNMEIIEISSENSEARLIENESERYIKVSGNSGDDIKITYSFRAEDKIKFTYDSKSFVVYENREYTFNERTKTTIEILPALTFRGGIHNTIDYERRERGAEIGTENIRYGIIIENNFDENISNVNLEILFPEENLVVISEGDRITTNVIHKTFNIGEGEKKIIRHNLVPIYTGNYSMIAKLEYDYNGKTVTEEFETIIISRFRPPNPNALFESKTVNSTSDMLIYLSNSNVISELRNLRISVKTIFGENKEEFDYFFRRVNITSTLLLNRMMKEITNATENKVIINGTYETVYGERLGFESTITVEEGYRRDYNSRLETVSRQNRFDLRVDNEVIEPEREIPQFWMTVYTLTGMVINEDNENAIYFLPIAILVIFIGIQVFITKTKLKK